MLSKYSFDTYLNLKNVNWEELKNVTQVITSYIIDLESDDMRIELVYSKLMRNVELLWQQKTQLSIDLSNELINVYVDNNNLIVPLAAFLITYEGEIFWQKCGKEYQNYYFKNGWDGICLFCLKSHYLITQNMKDIFTNHL